MILDVFWDGSEVVFDGFQPFFGWNRIGGVDGSKIGFDVILKMGRNRIGVEAVLRNFCAETPQGEVEKGVFLGRNRIGWM